MPLLPADSGSLDVRVRSLTQTIADHLADGIAKHPTDWHMLQKLWLDDQPSNADPSTGAATAPDRSAR